MGGFLYDRLAECRMTRELVAIHRLDEEPDVALVGFVVSVDERSFQLETIDSSGRRTGSVELPFERLEGIRRRSAFLIGLAYLHGSGSNVPNTAGRVAQSAHTVFGALRRALESGSVVSLRKQDEGRVTGLVRSLDDQFVEIEPIVDGIADGVLALRLSTLRSVTEGSAQEIREQVLYRAASGL